MNSLLFYGFGHDDTYYSTEDIHENQHGTYNRLITILKTMYHSINKGFEEYNSLTGRGFYYLGGSGQPDEPSEHLYLCDMSDNNEWNINREQSYDLNYIMSTFLKLQIHITGTVR